LHFTYDADCIHERNILCFDEPQPPPGAQNMGGQGEGPPPLNNLSGRGGGANVSFPSHEDETKSSLINVVTAAQLHLAFEYH